ncbi:MAG: 5'-nucleotidase C-terminal domain-containing protein [Faecalibacterium sp.]
MNKNKISRRNFLRTAGACATSAAVSCMAPAASACIALLEMDLQILATSDTHGMFAPWDYAADKASATSVAQQATAIKQLRTDATLVVDAGDTIQANSASLFLKDDLHPMMAAMNAIGYDVWTLGNHEFNYGMETLQRVMGQMKGKVLAGNVYAPDGTPLADGYTILNRKGVRIGVIGMVTPNIVRWDAANLAGWIVTNPVDESRRIIAEIKDKVDVLIGVMHMDPENEYDVAGSGARDVANACPEFAAIVAGHGHRKVQETINGVLVVENQNAAATMAEIHLNLKRQLNGKWKVEQATSELIDISKYEADPELLELLEPYDQRAKEDAHTVIGELRGGDLAPANEISILPQPMLQDTALLDFINEVQLYYSGAAVSATAMTSRTSQMKEGAIRKCDTVNIYVYDNTLYKVEMTGLQLREYMEWSAGFYQTWKPGDLTIAFDPSTRYYMYDAFQGVDYQIDISQEPGARIQNLTWPDGRPVEDDEVFTVAVNNYRVNTQLLQPGQVYSAGEALPKLLESDLHGEIGGIREMLGEYIRTVKGGVIEANVDNNWKVVGNNWDAAKHDQAVALVNAGRLSVSDDPSGRNLPDKVITETDLAAVQ